ncbi:hypothetical protein [Brevibacillus choshinensis]|uniref:Uncharacterized protein n=1 Tax=Brevibacillus choshinensis TaxID=54911 RepID=A0ABX7FNS3_BRECH|nr:hypothetical protein [Brevibacillus choshinensis]QRG66952.1 hypothetical protein JNE38_26335 [Brevibacillus choshinensis]
MSVQININGENAAEAVKELSSLAAHFILVPVTTPAITATPAEAQQEEKPKRQRAAKQEDSAAKQAAAPAPTPAEEPEEAQQDSENEKEPQASEPPKEEPTPPASDIPDIVELRARAQEIGKTEAGKKAIKALLDKFGSKSLSDLPEEKRADFMDELALL